MKEVRVDKKLVDVIHLITGLVLTVKKGDRWVQHGDSENIFTLIVVGLYLVHLCGGNKTPKFFLRNGLWYVII